MKVTTDSCLFGAWVAHTLTKRCCCNTLLDIGSGSGLLSLMIAQQTPAAIDAVEIQLNDFNQSLENIGRSPFKTQITVHHANALEFEYSKAYDVIVSNPPFYESDLKGHSHNKNIAHHDAGMKLKDLLLLVNQILSPTGACYLLLPAKRWEDLQKFLPATGLYINEQVWAYHSDKHPPFRVMLRASRRKTPVTDQHLYIRQNGDYSPGFKMLLKDYYLHL